MAQRIAGVAYLKAAGYLLPLRGNFTVSPSLYEKAMLAGQDYVHGFSEVPRVPFIEGDVSLQPEISMRWLASLDAITITAELANGMVYTLAEAICTAAFELNTRDGLTRVRFEGVYCAEFLSSPPITTEIGTGQTQTPGSGQVGGPIG